MDEQGEVTLHPNKSSSSDAVGYIQDDLDDLWGNRIDMFKPTKKRKKELEEWSWFFKNVT